LHRSKVSKDCKKELATPNPKSCTTLIESHSAGPCAIKHIAE
jgi:hypothetical protein